MDALTVRKINLLRLPLITLILYLHMYGNVHLANTDIITSANPVPIAISQFLARCAVPLFFIISAFLLARDFSLNLQSYTYMVRKRIHSIALPLMIWNIMILSAYALAQSIEALQFAFSQNALLIRDYTLSDIINAITGIGSIPIGYHLWFLRDLFLLCLLSPLFYIIAKSGGWYIAALLGLVWIMDPLIKPWFYGIESIFAFYIGILLATRPVRLHHFDNNITPIAFITLLATATGTWAYLAELQTISTVMKKIVIITTILFIWGMIGNIRVGSPTDKALTFGSYYAFFIYAAHEPLQTFLRKLSYRIVEPSHVAEQTLLYLMTPLCTLILTICTAVILKRSVPSLFRLLTGGRSSHVTKY